MGKPSKTNLFATNMSYRLPKLKIISGMTNIITAIMLNVFSLPRIMFYVVIKNGFLKVDGIMAYHWKKLQKLHAM